jgi:hypothetical protein
METGRVFYRDEAGQLWLAVSYVDEDGVTTTQAVTVDENAQPKRKAKAKAVSAPVEEAE